MNTAKIIAITQPLVKSTNTTGTGVWIKTGDIGSLSEGPYMTPEEFIAYTARVSNPTNQMNTETSGKLLRYCLANKHWSIFEQVSITMEIETTRDISHQIIRHRSFSFQEFSQRYADPTAALGFVQREARLQDTKNRQNSIENQDEDLDWGWELRQGYIKNLATENYNWAIENGIAKEQARAILPEGLTKTRLYMAGTLRSWIHYVDTRATEGTQKEHREVAMAARNELVKNFSFLDEYWFPKKVDWEEYEWVALSNTKSKPWWKFW